MKILGALAAAVLLHAFGALPLAAQDVTTAAPPPAVATTTTTPSPATMTTDAPATTTTDAPATTTAPANATTGSDDGDDGDELIGALRPGEIVEQIPTESFLLADAWSASAVETATTSAVKAPWVFKGDTAAAAAAAAPLLLSGRELTAYETTTTMPCTNTENFPDRKRDPFRVLVAVSSCFTKTAWKYVDAWVCNLRDQDARYFEGDDSSRIVFDVRTVDDGCNRRRYAAALLDTQKRVEYIATISIMVYTKGFKTIRDFNARNTIPTLIGFVYCGPLAATARGSDVATSLPGYTQAKWIDDKSGFLSPFNPFGAMRKIHCGSLPGGVPTSFLDRRGRRQCYCSCPVGTVLKDGGCKPEPRPVDPITGHDECECAWSTVKDGYQIQVSQREPNGQPFCRFTNLAVQGTTGLLPVPVVLDNYVDKFRANTGDGAAPSGPKIDLVNDRVAVKVTEGKDLGQENATATVSTSYTWTLFQSSPATAINSLAFTSAGRYDVELKATDYGSEGASCGACVLVIDAFRPAPNPRFTCPAPVQDVCVELTKTNIKKAEAAAAGVAQFKDNALNDPCGRNSRCDDDSLEVRLFTDAKYGHVAKSLGGASDYFKAENVKTNLNEKLKGSPFDASQQDGLAATTQTVCTLCVKQSTVLKEWWTDYKCGSPVASAKCDGSASCSLTQCIQVNGSTLARATATLKDDVLAASLAVARAKARNASRTDAELAAEYELGSSVHVALECNKFPAGDETANPKCTYTTTVPQLIDIATAPAVHAAALSDALFSSVNGYVSWRYKVDSSAWRDWTAAPSETFTKTETFVTLQAWTTCGMVQEFVFRVVLHLNSKIEVCEKFNDMWYQSTIESPDLTANLDVICMHPRSDFAELTFDYHPNIGLSTASFEMTIAQVKCSLQYEGASANATIVDVGGSTPAPASYQIVKQFAIDGVTASATKPDTTVFVACTFTYKRTLDATTESQVCNRKFIIQDCSPPKITKPCPEDAQCDFNKCARSGVAQPDLWQACGGNRVSLAPADLTTTLTTTEATCCESCNTEYFVTTCATVSSVPKNTTTDSLFIKRCETEATTPSTGGGGGDAYNAYSSYSVLEAVVGDVAAETDATTAAMVGATALVAVVALVAVRRRRQQQHAMVEADAYYPLMG